MEIKPVNPKGNQPWIYIRRTDAETSIFGYLVLKSWLTKKDPDAAKDWGQEEKGGTESEMVRWHPWLNGHEFEQTLGDSKRQGILVCCNSWVTKRVGHSLETEQQQHLHTAFSFCLLPPSLPCFYRLKERPSMRAVSYVLLGQNEDYSLGDRISDRSEKLLQRGTSAWLTVLFSYLWKKFSVLLRDKVSVIHDFSEGVTCSHAHILAEVCC